MNDTGILGVKTWRQRKGISLATIAASTKISVRLLEAIESGEFKKLPGGIYNTSYIRQYARAVDVDESELVAVYEESTAGPANRPAASKSSIDRFLPALQE